MSTANVASTSLTMSSVTTVITPEGSSEKIEQVAIESPYSIALNDETIGSSMVLPVALEEFGAGFLFGQGYIKKPEEVREVIVCPEGRIAVFADVDVSEPKEVIITSGCGGTGKISKEMLEGAFEPLAECTITFPEIADFIRQSLQYSPLGPQTHCVHGCGFWQDGKLQVYYEDVGRHNAVDKVLGAILLGKITPRGAIYTTGRLTSDMVLKCARIGIPIIMSRTAPSSLGLAIARRAGATLAAYARPDRLNIFHAPQRIVK
ncbi:formate dehydrogenase accessory sulfurtransferase FdhD [Desulforhopalus sp. IMCC35007]|uniref:formate dehydrogenase accessory sulfurtransferase FdhD n=1 Tax=Desulforhopalus sp. IMCC35007 TaxID=2569543 RepID=UPI0010ADFC1A|nr:formate dehydrogenase accessory sulfurtransferase FdhD [Desulforhopalus sp. IMCC35007]TKB06298.1 formate dehydrogenase accessory sulfurtransferase FdhD [Desulforhopalus sp. IMCC35007]